MSNTIEAETMDTTGEEAGGLSNQSTSNPAMSSEIENSKQETSVDADTKPENGEEVYSYLERNEFSSERFKIEVSGLPKYYGIGQFKKYLSKLQINAHKLKPIGNSCMFIGFRSEEERQDAVTKIQSNKFKSHVISVKLAKAMADPLAKRKNTENRQDDSSKKPKVDNRPIEERICEATLPLHHLPYEEQLNTKHKTMLQTLKNVTQEIKKANPSLRQHIKEESEKNDGVVCRLEPYKPSPILEGYRNKCEFTVGKNPDTDELTVGFRVSSYKAGSNAVGPVEHLPHLPDSMKKAVMVTQQYMRNSGKAAFDPKDHSGFWRVVTVRTSQMNDVMVIIVFHPQSMTEQDIQDLKVNLKQWSEEGPAKGVITSLYIQYYATKKSGEDPPLLLITGPSVIHEKLFDLKFAVAPTAFFQTNTAATEVLYNLIGDMAGLDQDTALIDVCCGTGTIGISLAKKCGQVVGIELIPQAVENAKANAETNGLTNCEFLAGKAEDLMSLALSRVKQNKVVAVIDPPRAGVLPKCTIALRHDARLQALIFVCCDAKAATKSLVDLCRAESNTYKGEPFVPVHAVPLDMFPHTPHSELVVFFKRQTSLSKV